MASIYYGRKKNKVITLPLPPHLFWKGMDTDYQLDFYEFLSQLPPKVGVSHVSLHSINFENLHVSKVCVWTLGSIPSFKTAKKSIVDAALQFFLRYVFGHPTYEYLPDHT